MSRWLRSVASWLLAIVDRALTLPEPDGRIGRKKRPRLRRARLVEHRDGSAPGPFGLHVRRRRGSVEEGGHYHYRLDEDDRPVRVEEPMKLPGPQAPAVQERPRKPSNVVGPRGSFSEYARRERLMLAERKAS